MFKLAAYPHCVKIQICKNVVITAEWAVFRSGIASISETQGCMYVRKDG